MARNIVKSVAELLLDGEGLEVAKRTAEALLIKATESKPVDLDRVRSLSSISAQLIALGEEKGGAS